MARILAIDYGLKRCGIAVTDEFQIIATALTTVDSKTIFDFLKQYFAKEKVEQLVVGYPKDLLNRDTHGTKPVEDFVKKMNQVFPDYKIDLVDERFTSKMASQSMVMSGMKKSQRQEKGLIDQISATIILQHYLETKNRF